MSRTWSLRSHVALLSAVLVVAVTTIMGSMVADRLGRRTAEETGRSLTQTASGLASRLEADMTARANEIAGLGQIPSLLDPAVAGKVAAELLEVEPALAWFGVMDTTGQVVASSHGVLQGKNIKQRPVFSEGIKGPFVGDVHQAVLLAGLLQNYGFGHSDDGSEVRFVDVSRPIVGLDGQIRGVVAAHFSWDWAGRLARSVSADAGFAGLDMIVVGTDNTILAGPSELVGHRLPASATSAVPGNGRDYRIERWDDGKDYLVGGSARGPLGWRVLARERLSDAMAASRMIRRDIMLWGSGFALLFSLLGWYGAGYLSRPLQAISDAAERMAGEITTETIPKVGGSVEVEALSRNLRRLIGILTARDAAIADLSQLAEKDGLTGLANRRAFDRKAQSYSLTHSGPAVTVMLVDLDDFKPVNDIHGHAAGDVVLKMVGLKLRRCLRPDDFAARIGGDEFALVFDRVLSMRDASAIASRIVEAVSAPLVIDGNNVLVGCCVGIARYPDDGATFAGALEAADRALYQAKRSGKGRVCSAAAEHTLREAIAT